MTNNKMPIVAITTDLLEGGVDRYSQSKHFCLRTHYAEVLQSYGCIPIAIIPGTVPVPSLINLVAGFILPGGDVDIDPSKYGENTILEEDRRSPERIDFDLEISLEARKRNIPLLGICLGMQEMNVSAGGSLKNCSKDNRHMIMHNRPNDRLKTVHSILIKEGTQLSSIAGNDKYEVNSSHRQIINKIGANLIVSAVAEDNTVEALEDPEKKFFIGAQWHPEFLSSEIDKELISAFASIVKQ